MYQFNFNSIPSLFTAVFLLGLATFILIKSRKITISLTFALLCLSSSLWHFGFFMTYLSKTEEIAFLWSKFVYFGVPFITPTMYHFSVAFLNLKRHRKLIILFYILAVIFAFLNITTYVIRGVYKYGWGYYPKVGIFHPFFTLIWCVPGIAAVINLYKGHKKAKSPIERERTKYMFWSLFIALFGMWDFIPGYGLEFYPFGFIFVLIPLSVVAYAIVKHRLMDISVVITRGLAYGALTTVIAGAYIGLMVVVDRVFGDVAGYSPTLAHALLFILVFFALIYVLPQMKIRAIEITRRALFRGKYDYQQELSEAARMIPTMLDFNQLADYILTKIKDTVMVDKLAMLVYDEAARDYSLLACFGLDEKEASKIKIRENTALVGLLRDAAKPLIKEEVKKQGTEPEQALGLAISQLDALGAELCIPLILKEDLTGFITLSNKRTGEMYTEEDLSLLSGLANQVALTIEYIKAVDKLTSEKRYVGLGKAAMRMAHDIKNPLVPLKTFLQILPDKYPKEFARMSKIDAEFTGRFYESALDGVDRINLLIERALHYARHPEPIFSQVQLDSLLDDVLTEEEIDLRKVNVQLEKQYSSSLNSIQADGEQLLELFSNLISNSIDAMESSPTRKLIVNTRAADNRVVIEIIDTGCGIAKDKIDTIFDPFITYKHKGSGLGLAIAKKIVDDHKGTIEVNSEPGKGASFKVILPREQ